MIPNRLLSQQGIKDQNDLTAGTIRPAWRAGSNQWLAEGAVHADWDASGQPEQICARHYRWDALGKLVEVRLERQPTVRYAYNHRGERIRKDNGTHGNSYLYEHGKLSAELDEHGRITRQYLYLADQPITVLDTLEGVLPDGEERSAPAQVAADIALALHAWFNDDEQLAFLHANHLGAIKVATAAETLLRHRRRPFRREAGRPHVRAALLHHTAAGLAFYPVLVHRLEGSLHASSPRSVALPQLRFTSLAVVSLREDFHLQECAHAGRTRKGPAKRRPSSLPMLLHQCDVTT
jgi:YD repeat-containing protein